MSQYLHLPIYNVAFEFLKELQMRVPKFAKQYKYFLGGKLIELNIDIIRLIIEANNHRDMSARAMELARLSEKIELLILHTRIAEELEQWGNKKGYLFLVEKLADLSKQAEGWRKSTLSLCERDRCLPRVFNR
jgi:hypothetical protein